MKNPIKKFINLFSLQTINEDDSALIFIGEYSTDKVNIKDFKRLLEIKNKFPSRDKVTIQMEEAGDWKTLKDDAENDFFSWLENIDGNIRLKVKVEKNGNQKSNVISIYNFDSFYGNFEKKDIISKINQILAFFNRDLFLYFDCFDLSADYFFKTNQIAFCEYQNDSGSVSNKRNMNYLPVCLREKIEKNVYPDMFHSNGYSNKNKFYLQFKIIEEFLSIVFLAYEVNIYETYFEFNFTKDTIKKEKVNFEDLQNSDFYRIYDWVFENERFNDKLVITQSIFGKNSKVLFEEEIITSISKTVKRKLEYLFKRQCRKILR